MNLLHIVKINHIITFNTLIIPPCVQYGLTAIHEEIVLLNQFLTTVNSINNALWCLSNYSWYVKVPICIIKNDFLRNIFQKRLKGSKTCQFHIQRLVWALRLSDFSISAIQYNIFKKDRLVQACIHKVYNTTFFVHCT